MKIYILIMSDREMRPRSDVMTTAVFPSRDEAIAAMEQDIANAIENEQVSEGAIERCPDVDYAASVDGRFAWKVEERIVRGDKLGEK